jgi:hypothetical protein
LIVFIFCLFNIYTTVALQQKTGLGFIPYTIERTIYLLTHSPGSIIDHIIVITQDYLMSILTLVVMLAILVSRPFIIGKHQKLVPIYAGAYVGFCLGCFLQGVLNLWGIYTGDPWIPMAFNNSLALIVFAVSATIGLVRALMPELDNVTGSHLITQIIVVNVVSLVFVLALIGTGVFNIPLSLSSPGAEKGQSVSDILTDTIQRIMGYKDDGSPAFLFFGINPLQLLAMALTGSLFSLLTLSFMAKIIGITATQLLTMMIVNVRRSIIVGKLQVKTIIKNFIDARNADQSDKLIIPKTSSPDSHDFLQQSDEYKEDIRNLVGIAIYHGHDNIEYVNAINTISKKYNVTITNIVYDEWYIRQLLQQQKINQ